MIKQSKPETIYSSNYRRIDFSTLYHAYNSSDAFIGYDQLNFDAQIGYQNLTGNELIYYPQLAKALRNVPEYPILKKSYKASKDLTKKTGMEFLIAFTEFAKQCHQEFEQERALLSSRVNNYIQMFGMEKAPVMINGLVRTENGTLIGIEINGIKFELAGRYHYSHKEKKAAECINIDYLVYDEKDQDSQRYRIIEDYIPESPYLAIRYKKYRQTGHLVWYNLDTLQRVNLKDIKAIKRKKGLDV